MTKFQVGKLTWKKFLVYFLIAFLMSIYENREMFESPGNIKGKIIMILGMTIIPGSIFSILVVELFNIIKKEIKERNYLVLIAFIIFVYFFTRHYFKI